MALKMDSSLIIGNALDLIGNTPLVEISPKLNKGRARVIAKVERGNPGGSTKDRVALEMIETAEKSGVIAPGATIIEPTSGNTGVGLALVAAVKGYHLILTMPDTMSIERRKLAAAYGAEIVLTPGAEGMTGAIDKAKELHDKIPGSFIPQQFENPANPYAHYKTTGPEIWNALDGELDVFVACVGTGGTFTGTARYLKEKNPLIDCYGVEPANSAVLSGGKPGPHGLQGIGAGFIPKVMDVRQMKSAIAVTDEDAGEYARLAAKCEGLLVGITSGAALWAACKLSEKEEYTGKTIVTLLPDTGERYLSTWLFN